MESESLQPQLELAKQTLEKALVEACGIDLRDIDTGELMRMEETLVIATKAAKDAVSVRLEMRSRRKSQPGQSAPSRSEVPTKITHRVFDDIRGTRWQAYAVHPSVATAQRVALPEAFRQGWLSFESAEEVRRVAPIPERWEEFSIDDLRQLCYKAPSTPKRLTAVEGPHVRKPPKA